MSKANLPSSVVNAAENYSAGAVINLNAAYGVTPGEDITTVLQAAINTLTAAGGGVVEISQIGTYLISGASQTGVVASTTLMTTANGAQTLPALTLTVASTSGFQTPGVVQTSAGPVTYTGITSTTFTGCTGGSGAVASGSSVAQAYQYAGQILFPATNFFSGTQPIKIRATCPPTTGIGTTGLASGVVLQSNATSGYVFDTVPLAAGSAYNWLWTGVMPMLENIIVRLPSNPQCGGVNLRCAQRSSTTRLQVDSVGAGASNPGLTGSLEGLVLPNLSNNGDVTNRDLSIRGVPYGVRLTEHNQFIGNTEIVGCIYAFIANAGTHLNNLGEVDVEDCTGVFTTDATALIGPVKIVGHLDYQTISVFIKDPIGLYQGFLTQTGNANGGLGGIVTSIASQLEVGNVTIPNSGGWSTKYVDDDFTRAVALTSTTGAPGQAWPSMHPWRVPSGTCAVSSNKLTFPGSGQAYIPTFRGYSNAEARTATASITLSSSGWNAGMILQRPYNTGSNLIAVRLNGQNVVLDVGSFGVGTVSYGVTLVASTAYTLTTELYYNNNSPWIIRGLLNNVPVFTYALTPTQQTNLAHMAFPPYLEDGLGTIGDTSSGFTSFVERPLSNSVPPGYLFEASATRSALHFERTLCTNGTFTVTLPTPTAVSVENVVTNIGTGTITVAPPSGTLTSLTGTTGNITLAQGAKAFFESDGTNWWQIA
jgi:hypothetical protein